jgi:hypothetical protein
MKKKRLDMDNTTLPATGGEAGEQRDAAPPRRSTHAGGSYQFLEFGHIHSLQLAPGTAQRASSGCSRAPAGRETETHWIDRTRSTHTTTKATMAATCRSMDEGRWGRRSAFWSSGAHRGQAKRQQRSLQDDGPESPPPRTGHKTVRKRYTSASPDLTPCARQHDRRHQP